MRITLFTTAALAGAALAGDSMRRRSVNDQAGNIPTITPAPSAAAELLRRQASSLQMTDILASYEQEQSVALVLATAMPFSYFAIAITNPGEVSSILSSEFAAGKTPSWYQALPADVKSYLATASGGLLGESTPPALPYSIPSYSIPDYSDIYNSLLSVYSFSYSNPFIPAQTTVSIGGSQGIALSTASATATAALTTPKQQSTGLSTGAKIGIGVGVPIGVLGIGAIAGIFLITSHRRKKKQRQANSTVVGNFEGKPVGPPPFQSPPPQYQAPQYGAPLGQQMVYHPQGQVVELPPQSHVPELHSTQRPVYEM